MITKPMLAGTLKNPNTLSYPILASPKLDGIRCLKIEGQVVSRALKPIPNVYIRETLEKCLPNKGTFDGELITSKIFQKTTSDVMSFEGEPNFVYCLFDYVNNDPSLAFSLRLSDLQDIIAEQPLQHHFYPIPHRHIETIEELLEFEAQCLKDDFEGVMIRNLHGPYKCGRSTLREGYLLKLKRFADSEAKIIEVQEAYHNKNKVQISELGYTFRSTSKTGKIPAGFMGSFLVEDLKTKIQFGVGSGFTHDEKVAFWKNKDGLVGKIVKYKHQASGAKEAPRFPTFLGFREKIDLTD